MVLLKEKRKGATLLVALVILACLTTLFVSCKPDPEPEKEYKGTFYGWDSNEPGAWVKTEKRANKGEYLLEISYNDGLYTLSVDGEKIHSYTLKEEGSGTELKGETKVKEIILQSLNNGTEYSVSWALPTVVAKDQEISIATEEASWQADRTEPKSFTIEEGKCTVTTTDANIQGTDDNRFYRFQGKKVAVSMTAAKEWKVSTTLYFDESLLDVKDFAPSIWLNVVNSNDANIDWCIIELHSDKQ